jgi:hypothetical protein
MQEMKKTAPLFLFLFLGFFFSNVETVLARGITPTLTPAVTPIPTEIVIPTETKNLTEVVGKKEEVAEVKWNGWNPIRVIVNRAIRRGVPENTIVLLLLLPLIASIVSVLHYVVGVSGYGIFMPTMMAVALLATGLRAGLILFIAILGVTLLGNMILRKWKLHFWPGRSITLLIISLTVFAILALAAYFGVSDVEKISIFPILFMILLTEEFIRTQLSKSKKEALRLTVGTLLLAIFGATLMKTGWLRDFVLEYSEIVILTVIVVNIIVGRYGGIRLTEIKRFKGAIRNKK